VIDARYSPDGKIADCGISKFFEGFGIPSFSVERQCDAAVDEIEGRRAPPPPNYFGMGGEGI